MKSIIVLIVALLIFGICGVTGGFVMLWAGNVLSRIDAFGVTPFQAAVVCVGFTIVCAVIVDKLMTPFLFSRLMHKDEEEEEDDFLIKRVINPKT